MCSSICDLVAAASISLPVIGRLDFCPFCTGSAALAELLLAELFVLLEIDEEETSELLTHWVIDLLIFVPLLALRFVCMRALSLKRGRASLPTPDTPIANIARFR